MHKRIAIIFNIILLLVVCSGCGASRKYMWKNYDSVLYRYYKNPAEKEVFLKSLKKIIDAGEKSNSVPPGLYAEYAYILYEMKKYPEAIVFFEKEKILWPMSSGIMDNMIKKSKAIN